MKFDFSGSENLPKMRPEEFAIFRDFICEKTGIKVRDTRIDYLEYRIQERMMVNGITDYREYYYTLKYDYSIKGELQQLINLVTVHETSFFRHAEQLETLVEVVLTRLVEKKKKSGDKRLRLWSAACATGEEPLTMAMILKESYPELSDWSITITATDLSTRALEKANRGIYGESSFRHSVAIDYQNKYFSKDNGHYRINDDIKKMVNYRNVNLVDLQSLNAYQGMDIILCRNVFIYFPEGVKNMISRKFFDILNESGTLMLGNAENVDVKKVPFKLEFHKGGPLYIK